jgi:hypothetical protein
MLFFRSILMPRQQREPYALPNPSNSPHWQRSSHYEMAQQLRLVQREVWNAAIRGGRRHLLHGPRYVKHFSPFAGMLFKP